MSIAGIGTDLVEIERVERILIRFPERFARRVLVDQEYDRWRARGGRPAWLAKRYAAKEALAKALGTGIGAEVSFHDLVMSTDDHGAPRARLEGGAKALADRIGIRGVHVSLTDESGQALAFVVLEK
ncbi:MAG: holo-ACP synthase [Aquisalimonadaceae bacterium]